MRVSAEALNHGWVGMYRWVLFVGRWVGCSWMRRLTFLIMVAVKLKRPYMVGGWVQVKCVLVGGSMGCCVRRFTTTNTAHHQHFLVKRCTSAKESCLAGEHHGPNKCGQHHPTLISLLSHARQRENHGIQWMKLISVTCRQPSTYTESSTPDRY